MKRVADKRSENRYRLEAPLILTSFPSFDAHPAENLNQSSNGIAFKTGVYLKPGTIVYIRRERCPKNCPGGDACTRCRTHSLATIKWCNENGASGSFLYSAGAKYFEY